jgi:putative oxidoreductase
MPGIPAAILSVNALTARLDALQPLVALGTRLWVSWQFLKAGLLKVQDWDTTLYLFRDEYRVPLLSAEAAAVAGTVGEIVFPVLLALGLLGRVGAIGLFLVNALAVVAYAHVLLQEGFEAAVAQHYLWGFMLLVLAVYGNGPLALDRLLGRSAAPAHG